MPKVMVDLDVVTIAKWHEKRDLRRASSQRFMIRVERDEFSLLVPDEFLEILKPWEYVELMRRVRGWYTTNAKFIISSEEALKKVTAKTGLSEETLIEKLALEADMKTEDIFLVSSEQAATQST